MIFKILLCLLSLTVFAQDKTDAPIVRTMKDKDLKWGPCPDIFPSGCEVSVLHGDPTKDHADVYMRVPGKYVIPAYSHTSSEHITLVSGNLKVKYQGMNQ
ncbi:MAG TPA: hypothetical protein VNJ08_04275 [Bacteriovoracaceae bacterium]|nr:hypothetical protein [Bacteriovoracaceae bacterium]